MLCLHVTCHHFPKQFNSSLDDLCNTGQMLLNLLLYSTVLRVMARKQSSYVQSWSSHWMANYMLASTHRSRSSSYDSRRHVLPRKFFLGSRSMCCLPFHGVVMQQSSPLRGQPSSSGLGFCHPSSLSVSKDSSSWVRLLPLRKKTSYSIPFLNNLSFFLVQTLLGERLEKSCLYSSKSCVIVTPNK